MRPTTYDLIAQSRKYPNMRTLLQQRYKLLGASIEEIADLCGLSHGTIRKLLALYGIELRQPKARPEIPVKELQECTIDELKAKYGIGRSTAWRMKKALA